jgi:hypothetical protein
VRVQRLAAALLIAAIGLVACGDGGGAVDQEATASPEVEPSGSASTVVRQKISIETKVTVPTGEVLPGSVIGDDPFCSGGTLRDEHGNAEVGLVLRTFTCPEGELKVGFSPTEDSLTQTSTWYIVRDSGTGSFEGLRGNGRMTVTFEEDGVEGRESFTGEVAKD